MKMHILILALAASAAWADPTPRLVPRPIPGMVHAPRPASTQVVRRDGAPAKAAGASQGVPSVEAARIVFIHRAATLPPELRLVEKPRRPEPAATAIKPVIQERPGKLRIIPQSEAAALAALAEKPAALTAHEPSPDKD